MPRKPVISRKKPRTTLTSAWKYFFETGRYTNLKKLFPDIGPELTTIWLLTSPGNRIRLRQVWGMYRDEFMHEWHAEGKKGIPWAVKELDNVS